MKPRPDKDTAPAVVAVTDDDQEMKAAMRAAYNRLFEFIDALRAPGAKAEDFFVKARFEEGDHVEHMWLANVKRIDHGFSGTLNNDPIKISQVKAGAELHVDDDEVSDWMYKGADGTMHGGFTVEVLKRRAH